MEKKSVIMQAATEIYIARIAKDGLKLEDFEKVLKTVADAYKLLER